MTKRLPSWDGFASRRRFLKAGLLWLPAISSLSAVRLLQHRRSAFQPASGFSDPSDISGMIAWYQADTGAYEDAGTDPCEDGDAVVQWNDQSGNGRNLSVPGTQTSPTYVTSAQNSLPAINFDSSNDALGVAFGASFAATTWFAVAKNENTTSYQFMFDGDDSVNRHVFNQLNSASAGKYNAYAGTDVSAASALTDATTYIFTAQIGNSTGQARANGTQILSGNTGTKSMDGITVGNRYPTGTLAYLSWIAELIGYDSHLSAANISNVENWLNTKWAVY